jgi:hypothetical protein
MVIINIGMPRSGTLWRYKIIRDLVMAAGGKDGSDIRKRYFLHPFYRDLNAHIDTLSNRRLPISTYPSLLGETYVLNTHAGPTRFVQRGLQNGRIKAIYGYRDPRDCILSMLEYSRNPNPNLSVADFKNQKTIEDAAKYMLRYLEIWKEWYATGGTLMLRYESQLEGFEAFIQSIITYLGLELDDSLTQEIISRYLPKQPASDGGKTHFSKGIARRYETEFSPEEKNYLSDQFGPYLEQMGYPA